MRILLPELMAAGVTVAFGHGLLDGPLVRRVRNYTLEVAHMGLHVAQMTSQKGIRQCFDAVTTSAAKVMHLQGRGWSRVAMRALCCCRHETP